MVVAEVDLDRGEPARRVGRARDDDGRASLRDRLICPRAARRRRVVDVHVQVVLGARRRAAGRLEAVRAVVGQRVVSIGYGKGGAVASSDGRPTSESPFQQHAVEARARHRGRDGAAYELPVAHAGDARGERADRRGRRRHLMGRRLGGGDPHDVAEAWVGERHGERSRGVRGGLEVLRATALLVVDRDACVRVGRARTTPLAPTDAARSQVNVCAVGPVAGPLRVATAPFCDVHGEAVLERRGAARVGAIAVRRDERSERRRAGRAQRRETRARGAPRTISDPSSSEPESPPAVALTDALSPSASVAGDVDAVTGDHEQAAGRGARAGSRARRPSS